MVDTPDQDGGPKLGSTTLIIICTGLAISSTSTDFLLSVSTLLLRRGSDPVVAG